MVLLRLGPGVANGLTNIHNAWQADSDMLVVVSEIATTHKGKGSVVDTDAQLCSKWAHVAHFAIETATAVSQIAFQACSHKA